MGAVYRAIDRTAGKPAALKILHAEAPPDHRERLEREARVLSDLTHPAIVRYLAFGHTPDGRPFLAMEWLDGEDLANRIRGDGIVAGDAVRLANRVASALGSAHARGVIHRDIKPSNLFLVDGDVDRVKVLDFGIARLSDHDQMTRTGAAIGTPRYMAPEQARGTRDLDARADVFSLGCVLFECLAGRPAFAGSSAAAILAKIVLEEAPRLATVRDGLPQELTDLVDRMLAKDPVKRPAEGGMVAAALGEIISAHRVLSTVAAGGAKRPTAADAVTTGEQRLLCVVFAEAAVGVDELGERTESDAWSGTSPSRELDSTIPPPGPTVTVVPDAPATATFATPMVAPAVRVAGLHEPTASLSMNHETGSVVRPVGLQVPRGLAAVVANHRGRCDVLADGSIVVTLLGEGAATDQAARAARCALAIRDLVPAAPIALAIGRGVVGDPMGELIDRATAMVLGPGEVRVDEVTAGLLDVRFLLEGDDHGLVLAGERDVVTPVRTLLGKPIPCIGRERELAALGALYEECVGEPMAHLVLVIGAPGIGKSRLRHELMQRLAQQGAELWIGRGDPMAAGAPFAMLSQALRRAAGIVDDEAIAVRRRKLTARVSRHVPAEDIPRVSEFLSELLGITLVEANSMQLRAARGDPQLMGDQMLRACEDFLSAECGVHPVVLVLEDLQWGDLPTVQFIDSLARRLADRPLLVLALARPDVDTVFPRLWKQRSVERINLGELTKRAAEKLVRAALGEDCAPDLVARLVERAAGNAFYLEELVRSVAEGYGDRLPETVVAMAQARIESLEPEVRHVLRAASIFGQTFWRGGVLALLERGDAAADEVGDWIDELVRRELVTARRDSRFLDEPEYVFRHALVREAAYAMLPDRDRMVGHRIAGEWLESRAYFSGSDAPQGGHADVEAVVLAEHFLRGNELRRSVIWYREAAELALEGNDLVNAIERAERAIACVHAVGDTGGDADCELVGVLRQLQSGAHVWRGEYVLAQERGGEALDRLAPASARWLAAAAAVAEASARRLDHPRVLELCAELVELAIEPACHRAYAYAVARTMSSLLWYGDRALADRLFARLDQIEIESAADPAVGAWVRVARSWLAMRDGDQASAMLLDASAEDCFTAVGDFRHACMQHANVGYGELMLGAFARAERSLREAIAGATRIGLPQITSHANHNLGLVLARQGLLDDAREVETAALDDLLAHDNRRLAAASHDYLAIIEMLAGNPVAAIEHSRAAIADTLDQPSTLCQYQATLSAGLRLAGDLPGALDAAIAAMDLVDQYGPPEEGESALRLAHAEALHAAGKHDEARHAIREASRLVNAAAAKIKSDNWRASFLKDVVENAAILALDRAWNS